MDNNIKMDANEIRGVCRLDSFGSRQGLSGYCSDRVPYCLGISKPPKQLAVYYWDTSMQLARDNQIARIFVDFRDVKFRGLLLQRSLNIFEVRKLIIFWTHMFSIYAWMFIEFNVKNCVVQTLLRK